MFSSLSVSTNVGAEVPLQLSKSGTTHLVCKEPGNPKHYKAIQWGLPALRQDWLFHVAKTGDASTGGFELPMPAELEETRKCIQVLSTESFVISRVCPQI
jgi:hypothetical protein